MKRWSDYDDRDKTVFYRGLAQGMLLGGGLALFVAEVAVRAANPPAIGLLVVAGAVLVVYAWSRRYRP
jgi:hypothetical protein